MGEQDNFTPVGDEEQKVSLWRKIRQLVLDLRQTWKNLLIECPASWRSIRSGLTWCCLLLITNGAYWLFGGLLFASLEGFIIFKKSEQINKQTLFLHVYKLTTSSVYSIDFLTEEVL